MEMEAMAKFTLTLFEIGSTVKGAAEKTVTTIDGGVSTEKQVSYDFEGTVIGWGHIGPAEPDTIHHIQTEKGRVEAPASKLQEA
jgi:hypothetical protein